MRIGVLSETRIKFAVVTAALPLWAACSLAPAGVDTKLRVNLGGQSSFSAQMNNGLISGDPSGLFVTGPPDVNQFECFALNVDGNGIKGMTPDSQWYSPKDPHSCRYPGVGSAAVSPADPSSGVIEMSVPAGAARLVQVLGFSSGGRGCNIGRNLGEIMGYLHPYGLDGPDNWLEAGWAVADLYGDTTLDITSSYDPVNPVPAWTQCAPNQTYDQLVLSDAANNNLRAYWRLEDGTGTSAPAHDSSLHQDGTYTGTSSPGAIKDGGNSMLFSAGQFLTAPTNATFNFNSGQGITFEFWFKYGGSVNTLCNTNSPIAHLYASGAAPQLGIGCGPTPTNGVYFNVQEDGGVNVDNAWVSAATRIDDGNWHYLAGVRDPGSGSVLIYVDGLSGNVPLTANGTLYSLDQGFSTQVYPAYFDEIAVYSRALAPGDIATRFNHHL
ncbi:MAG TPA: LamG domain-containing protein [Bdellovibrionota bacterium]|jgi:hypothetical protein|nr:LamG domain-containing protein [Bdellovibrionota bacterium]